MSSLLQGLRPGLSVRPVTLGRRNAREVVDASKVIRTTDPTTGLVLVPIDHIFASPEVIFIGIGVPNTFTVLPSPDGESVKFDAFMFGRKPTRVVRTKGRVQSGVFYELRELPPAALAAIHEAMPQFIGKRTRSCTRANAQMLATAGFSCQKVPGGRNELLHVTRPSRLASLLWCFGLQFRGEMVNIRVVYTCDDITDHLTRTWGKEFWSMCRAARKVYTTSAAHVSAPVFEPYDGMAQAPLPQPTGPALRLGVSKPSFIGAHLAFLFGHRPIYQTWLPMPIDAPELLEPLPAFPVIPDKLTWVKRYVLFNRPPVWFIRRQLVAKVDYFDDKPASEALAMLRTSQFADSGTAFKYNLVVTGTQVILGRLRNDTRKNGSRTNRLLNWVLAKHVLLSGWDDDVRFSGEVWAVHEAEGLTIYVNSNSGTYKPVQEKRLEAMVEYLTKAFGVRVVPVWL